MSIEAAPPGAPPGQHHTRVVEIDRQMVGASIRHDYATERSGGIVPLDKRRPLWAMAGLWLTMNCGFGEIFIGFQYHQAGFSLVKSTIVSVVGCALYFCYAVPASYLGSRTGQTHSLLARSVFGKFGAIVVAVSLLIMGCGFVGFQSNVTAQIFDGLLGWQSLLTVGLIVTAICITNNLLGFSGVMTWARYVVAPVVVLWIAYMMIRAFATSSAGVLGAHPHATIHLTTLQGIGAMLGVAVWGDEPDFWRFGKPRGWWSAAGLAFGLVVGDIFFTVGGWVMAQLAGNGDYSHSVVFVTHYSLFGLTWLAFIVAGISQMAAQDGNYYAAINSLQGIFGEARRWSRLYSCGIAVAMGLLFTWVVTRGSEVWLNIITFGTAVVPSATVIMLADHYLVPKLFQLSRSKAVVPSYNSAGNINVPAVLAMVPAIIIGTFGAGSVPGFTDQYWLIPGPLSWLCAATVYIVGVALVRHTDHVLTLTGFSEEARNSPLVFSTVVDDVATRGERNELDVTSAPEGSVGLAT